MYVGGGKSGKGNSSVDKYRNNENTIQLIS